MEAAVIAGSAIEGYWKRKGTFLKSTAHRDSVAQNAGDRKCSDEGKADANDPRAGTVASPLEKALSCRRESKPQNEARSFCKCT
jgi:hypothetical protein